MTYSCSRQWLYILGLWSSVCEGLGVLYIHDFKTKQWLLYAIDFMTLICVLSRLM
jgi:hypothetical protein